MIWAVPPGLLMLAHVRASMFTSWPMDKSEGEIPGAVAAAAAAAEEEEAAVVILLQYA